MAVPGQLQVTIKINQMPTEVKTDDRGWKTFDISCDGWLFILTVRPKVFKRLEDAQANWPLWVASITGKIGKPTKKGFILEEPGIQVFEKKPKEPQPTEGTTGNEV